MSLLTDAEKTIVGRVLAEIRHAAAIGRPLHITVDPFLIGDGARVTMSYDLTGQTFEVSGRIRRNRRATRTAKLGADDAKKEER